MKTLDINDSLPCPTCWAYLEQIVTDGRRGIFHCDHRAVLVVLRQNRGALTEFSLKAPVSADAAAKLMAAVEADSRRLAREAVAEIKEATAATEAILDHLRN